MPVPVTAKLSRGPAARRAYGVRLPGHMHLPVGSRAPGGAAERPPVSPETSRTLPREGPTSRLAGPTADTPTLTDRSVRVLAERLMPLARYYQHHGGPLLAEPLGVYYVRGRWCA
jgi:hypothetical protein